MDPGLLLRRLLAVGLLLGSAWVLADLIGDLNRGKMLKSDLAEINHVRYGLLDADEWVERIAATLEKKVDELDLTEANRAQVTAAVARLLDTLLREVERNLRQRNLATGGTWLDQLQGALQQGLQDLLLDFDRLRERVPEYAEALVAELARPGTKEQLKAQLRGLLRQAVASSVAGTDRSSLEALLARRGCSDEASCSASIEAAIIAAEPRIQARLGTLLGVIALLAVVSLAGPAGVRRSPEATPGAENASRRPWLTALAGAPQRLDPVLLFALSAATLLLLIGGLATPMIEVDARITELAFQLVGEPIVFTNQVLYFQTKSIFDVIRILFESGAADMLLVAVLLSLFSVIFPAFKLMATYAYYADYRGARASAAIRFFALRSGKWSMADVMVIAVFMAYIGFDALVENQLGSLKGRGEPVAVLTTNATSLEPGFFLFLTFVLLGLLLSSALERGVGADP